MAGYKLSATLAPPHQADVKAVAILNDRQIVSASRDGTVRLWTPDANHKTWQVTATFAGHQGFVNSVACLPATSSHPNGLIVTGGQDTTVQVWDPSQPDEPIYILLGHSSNVCHLATHGDHIISTSWDTTAIVWDDYKQKYHLKGHTAAVWSAIMTDVDTIVTGSADKSIKLWQGQTLLRTIDGAHGDVVRSIAPLPGIGFLSAANDATIKVWSTEGEPIQTLHGHTSFIYAVKALATDTYVSSGEDRSIRVWRDGDCAQVIPYPAISVWTVTAFSNGDLVAGGSDGMIRCFTTQAERMAAPDAIEAYEHQIAQQALPQNQVGDIQKDKLPGADALQQPGKKEGEVKMVRVGTMVEAHQWSMQSSSWTKIGEVVDAIGSDRKQLFDGKEYDYVFDVALEDNAPALKLPFNATENPYEAAQRFIHRHELPQSYLEQIASFIMQNAKGATLGVSATAADPFTGGGRYIPSSSSSTSAPSAVPRAHSPPRAPEASSAPVPVAKDAYSTFRTLSAAPLKKKILETNTSMPADKQLNDQHFSTLEDLVQTLAEKKSALTTSHCDIITTLLFWPPQARLPGLDLLRTALLRNNMGDFGLDLIGLIRLYGLDAPSKKEDAVIMLGVRAVANLFPLHDLMLEVDEGASLQLLQTIAGCLKVKGDAKHIHIAGMTFYLNLTLLAVYHSQNGKEALLQALLQILVTALKSEKHTEAYLRGLAALSTLVFKTSGAIREQVLAGWQAVREHARAKEHQQDAQVMAIYKHTPSL